MKVLTQRAVVTAVSETGLFLDALAKLQKSTVNFVLSVCMEHLCSHWTEFRQIRNLSICRKAVNFKVATKFKYRWKRCLKRFPVWRIFTAVTSNTHRPCRSVEEALGDLVLCGRDLILVKAVCL